MEPRIERALFAAAPRDRVWRALTDPAEFGAWFCATADGPFVPGARVRMTSTHPSCPGLHFTIAIHEVAPPRSFSWRWHPGAQQPPEGSGAPTTHVEFRLEEERGGTRVTVTESGFEAIPPERRAAVFQENSQGWEEQMASLSRYLARQA